MSRCQRHEFLTPAVEERVSLHDERAGTLLNDGREGRVKIAPSVPASMTSGFSHVPLPPRVAGIILHNRIFRVDEESERVGFGNQLMQQLELLCPPALCRR